MSEMNGGSSEPSLVEHECVALTRTLAPVFQVDLPILISEWSLFLIMHQVGVDSSTPALCVTFRKKGFPYYYRAGTTFMGDLTVAAVVT